MPESGATGNRSIILRNADSKGRALSLGRVHAPPHWLQAVPPLTTKLSFPAQIRRCQVLNLATRVKTCISMHFRWVSQAKTAYSGK